MTVHRDLIATLEKMQVGQCLMWKLEGKSKSPHSLQQTVSANSDDTYGPLYRTHFFEGTLFIVRIK